MLVLVDTNSVDSPGVVSSGGNVLDQTSWRELWFDDLLVWLLGRQPIICQCLCISLVKRAMLLVVCGGFEVYHGRTHGDDNLHKTPHSSLHRWEC
jgi:hypothetical protein